MQQILTRIKAVKSNNAVRPKVFVMGISFKPDVDDVRQSPALFITQQLQAESALLELKVYDHNVPVEVMQKCSFDAVSDAWRGITWADVIVVLVKHKEFVLMQPEVFADKIVIDTCGLFHAMKSSKSNTLLEGAIKSEAPFWKNAAMKDAQ